MVENFRVSWFEKEKPAEKVVKVPYSGGYSKDYDNVFKLAFSTHEIKTVYYGMDIFTILEHQAEETRFELPEYLYDNNLLNDVQYIFNKDIFYQYTIQNLENLIKNIHRDNDLAYNWNDVYKYGKEETLKTYIRPKKRENGYESTYIENYANNMRNITQYIEEYPETKFKIFIPPYSILYWDNAIRKGDLETQIKLSKKVINDLLKYENVEIYYFQNIEDIITNFDNYKDYTHYKEEINYYMFESMCITGEHQLTKENYINEINKMYDIAIHYDYDKIFENQ